MRTPDVYRPPENVTPVKRECLRCEKVFIAVGRFNRLCKTCKPAVEDIKAGTLTDLVDVIV